MAGLIFLLAGISAAAGHGYHHHGYHHHKHPKCTREIETVTKELCRLEFEKTCKTETKTFFKITGFEDKDCKEVEVCKHGYGEDILTDIVSTVNCHSQDTMAMDTTGTTGRGRHTPP